MSGIFYYFPLFKRKKKSREIISVENLCPSLVFMQVNIRVRVALLAVGDGAE